MLNVQSGYDVNARCQNFFHILKSLGIAAAGYIRVRQLIHQDDRRFAGEDRPQIHLLDFYSSVNQSLARDGIDTEHQTFGFRTAMSFDQPGYDVDAVVFEALGSSSIW